MTDSETAELSILFGSQTGNAEYLAYQIHAKAVKQGLDAGLASLEDWLAADRGLKRLLVVTSTHDNGHMPDNASEFWSWLQGLAPDALSGLPYAVLSIGDSMYEDFCKAGHDIDQRLEELGAVRIVESIDCDIDFEFSAERWATPAVQALIESSAWSGAAPLGSTDQVADAPPSHGADGDQLCRVRIAASRVLSGEGSAKSVTHYELSFDEGSFDYAPGDSLSVFAENSEALVGRWIDHFGDREVDGRPLQKILTQDVELRLPHPGLIVGLARRRPNSAPVEALVALIQSGDREALDAWLWGRDVLDVLFDLECQDLPIDELLDELRPLQHRDYSISSSPLRDDGRVHLTVAGVEYEGSRGSRSGTATDFLRARAADGQQFTVRRVPAHEFHLPADDRPMIMIGPGVGVAPFRAFLRERDARGASGDNWLFFGDQHRAHDWLYQEEFEDLGERGVLDRIDLAFSRDQADKRYVQHAMRESAPVIRAWLDAGAYIFVCGDKARMAADVDRALAEILGAGDAESGQALIAELKRTGRYVKDVY